jgi:hypothetical protein
MNIELGSIPRPDPSEDAALRATARRRRQEGLLFVALLFGQVGLASLLGTWAASGWSDPGGNLSGLAAVGFVMLLIGAHSVGYGCVLVFGSVVLLARVPRLFRRRPLQPVRAKSAAGESPVGALFMVAVVAAHAATMFVGALLLCAFLALLDASAGFGAWWRFALAALALTPVTARLLLAWVRSETP